MAARLVAKKQKLCPDHLYLDLDNSEVQRARQYLPNLIKSLLTNFEPLRLLLFQMSEALNTEQVTHKEKVSILRAFDTDIEVSLFGSYAGRGSSRNRLR